MNKLFKKYFSRHQIYAPLADCGLKPDIRVVVPVYLEEEYIEVLLESLSLAAKGIRKDIELILVLNYSLHAVDEHKERQTHLLKALESKCPDFNENFRLSLIQAFDLPTKHAGAGLARKIGMDYAAKQFGEQENERGVIVSLDADCKVQSNYFDEIIDCFTSTSINACTIAFQHQFEGIDTDQQEAIAQYELHLRYYLQVLRWTGHPYAFHTVGSCFAVRAESYIRAGGMPRKQAGEDFYFLQKVIPMGCFGELNSTCVYPSSRSSDRVPFGTGPTVARLVHEKTEYETYNLQAFIELKELFDTKEKYYKISAANFEEQVYELSGRLRSFLLNSNFYQELENVNRNCASREAFNKRFFEVFDAFKVVKYLNYVHVHFLEKMPVYDAVLDFLDLTEQNSMDLDDVMDAINYFRQLEYGS